MNEIILLFLYFKNDEKNRNLYGQAKILDFKTVNRKWRIFEFETFENPKSGFMSHRDTHRVRYELITICSIFIKKKYSSR